MNVPTYNTTEGFIQKLQFALNYIIRGAGPLATFFEAGAFLKSSPKVSVPDIQLHFVPAGIANAGDEGPYVLPFRGVTILLNKSHPVSAGELRLVSADPKVAPQIECRILESEEDVKTLLDGIKAVRRIMNSSPIAQMVESEAWPGPNCTDDSSIINFIRTKAGIAYHPAGTCRMGVDEDAVVAPDLSVNGIKNLWVADASIMPDLISGNTNAVCMLIGEKMGRMF